ncbi:hypothetical protein KQ939_09410 [Planococcus sp. CP5-4]|uniref:hypothetical protein n=1 Tax=unclassified Planococcus (in: firmicutes) TaxID=2662419 RepID=UPI001C22E489|nr:MULTISPECIES: hypothetical protein [unclassified Planococcus (in: firmicutes)]MBU9673757.1 hypothetical protein [Planococcus sp. CP5-4_YE]MBV0908881.1 hypothetical protein [Planococcus sp. CP5-4_UN]MBW6063930.1 hypothetical protein [Planococcus sp. CP5-4]
MRTSAKLSTMAFLWIIISLLAGCATVGESPETLAIENRGEYEGVLVSSTYSSGQTAGYEETFIEGPEKADELIDRLNGKELIQASEAELQDRAEQLEQPGSYRMMLYNMPAADRMDDHMYLIHFYKDGTIQVDQEGVTYFLCDAPEDLLSQLKQQWNISF